MKAYALFALSLGATMIVVWALCAKFLGLAINSFAPSLSHDDYVDYWFAGFVLSELAVATAVFYISTKRGLLSDRDARKR